MTGLLSLPASHSPGLTCGSFLPLVGISWKIYPVYLMAVLFLPVLFFYCLLWVNLLISRKV